jgi:hypothetical protein
MTGAKRSPLGITRNTYLGFRYAAFSETASEFLCVRVSRCLLLGYATGAIGHFAPVLTYKDARS